MYLYLGKVKMQLIICLISAVFLFVFVLLDCEILDGKGNILFASVFPMHSMEC